MEILKFTVSGQGASFTRPHFNSIVSSYSHIHKVALLGMIGAIIGIEKAEEHPKTSKYTFRTAPDFYLELEDLEVSIVPHKVSFFSKEDVITDTTGYSNDSSTYVAKYQTLLSPAWDIYIKKSDNPHYETLKEFLLNGEAVYTPYLGRNHWWATIDNVEVLTGEETFDVETIDSLFPEINVETEENDDFLVDRIYFREFMPVELEEILMQYQEQVLALTNDIVISSTKPLVQCDNKTLYFI